MEAASSSTTAAASWTTTGGFCFERCILMMHLVLTLILEIIHKRYTVKSSYFCLILICMVQLVGPLFRFENAIFLTCLTC
ncbi:hypothetical protein RIF29_19477 [Crotalaria pallida]|uniref:Uncharacterized protein n=1 Tax=Crotalaria pallida TaxID=3830 RepID=A0AAN9F239_CROPI